MIEEKRFPKKVFFGWWTVLASGIVQVWGWGFHMYGFSVLFKPIASDLGFSRAVTSVAHSIARLEGGFEAPIAGWFADRFGPRRVVLLGISIFSLGLILMNSIDSLWAFYVVWGVIVGTGANISFSIPLEKAITNWFVKKRGTALGLRWMFSGLFVLPLISWLIITQGWRITCVIGGVVMLFVGLPLTWFFIRDKRPEYYGLLPDGATVEEETADTSRMIERGIEYATEVQEVEFTLRQAMRTPVYWLLILAQTAGYGVAGAVMIIHIIPFLTDMGLDPLKAATVVTILGLFSIASRFITGFLSDRVRTSHLRFLFGGLILLKAVGFTIFLLNQTIDMIYPFIIIYNIGEGASLTLMSIIRARYFGRKAFGSIRGSSMLIGMPVSIVAPIYAGWVYDTTGSYITAFILATALIVFSVVLLFLARPPKPPARVTDINKIL